MSTVRPGVGALAELHRLFRWTPTHLVAAKDAKVVGLVSGAENRLVNLFVAGSLHRQGIATQLHRRFEIACRKAGYRTMVVRSSLFAVPFYKSVGYRKTTGVRSLHGIRAQPMRKRLNP